MPMLCRIVVRWLVRLLIALAAGSAFAAQGQARTVEDCGANRLTLEEIESGVRMIAAKEPASAASTRRRLRPAPRHPATGARAEYDAFLCTLEREVRALFSRQGVQVPSDLLQSRIDELQGSSYALLRMIPRQERYGLANDLLDATNPEIPRASRILLLEALVRQATRRLAGDPSSSCRMEALAPTGYLTLAVDPPVEVAWGGRPIGETPLNAVELPSGCLELELFEPISKERRRLRVELRPDQVYVLKTTFRPPGTRTGTIGGPER